MAAIVHQEDIQRAATRLGLVDGAVCVHASLRSFGRVVGGADSVVQGLLVAGCTVLVPSFAPFEVPPPDDPAMRPARNGTDYASIRPDQPGIGRAYTPDVRDVWEEMGAISEAVLAMPERVRGNHPLNSFAAIGPYACYLVEGQEPGDVYRPLEMLVEVNGWVVLMGVGLTSMTLLHLAEKHAGRTLFRRWANDRDGQVMMVETGSCSRGFEQFQPVLAPLARQTVVSASAWRAFPARDTLEQATQAILRDPRITHCGDPGCARCRDAVLGGPILTEG